MQESPLFAVRQRNRRLAALGQFDDGPCLGRRRAGDGATAQQVATVQIAAAHGVLRQHLRKGPVLVAKIGVGHGHRAQALRTRLCGFNLHLQRNVQPAGRAVLRTVQVSQRLGLVSRALKRQAKWGQRFHRDNPR